MHLNSDVAIISKTRHCSDIKGGGLAVLFYRKHWNIEEYPSKHQDILVTEISKGFLNCLLIIVYASTNNPARNDIIYCELKTIVTKNNERNILILGDFNGHIGILGPQQSNANGKKLMNFTDDLGLLILNLDTNCSGEITRYQHPFRSTIDFALCNNNMYKFFSHMIIDEEQEEIGISDHNLITTAFEYKTSKKPLNATKSISINSRDEDDIGNYCLEVESMIEELESPPDMRSFNQIIIRAQDKHLKRTITINPERNPTNPPWVTKEVKEAISKLRSTRKKLRKRMNPEEHKHYKTISINQKHMVNKLLNSEIEKHERTITNKIMQDKNRNKKIYEHIKALREKHFNAIKPIVIYDELGEKLEKELPKEIYNFWTQIYQQHENLIPTKWNEESQKQYNEEQISHWKIHIWSKY